jgi:hypothetical protein
MVDTERDLSRINDGKMARLILSNLSPILDEIKQEAEQRFVSQFKSGKLDQGNSLAYAAVIGTIEDITNKLMAKVNMADRVFKERDNDGRSGNSDQLF